MKHPLDQAIERVRRAARRIALSYGISLSLAVLLAGALSVGLLDYLIRVDATIVRVLLSLAAVSIAGWGVWRFLLPPWRGRTSDVAVAQRLQDRFPELGDKLASAVEFLQQPEESPTAGSALLRRAVIVDATVAAKTLDLSEVLDARPLKRALLAVCAVAALITCFALLSPHKTWIGLARLANPLGSTLWPRDNDLDFRHVRDKLAAGELFEVELFDKNGSVPDDAQMEYRFGGPDEQRTFREPMRRLGTVMTASRENVQRSFSYRALAGDGETKWHDLKVVEPAKLESLEVTLIPPAYTGWPRETSHGAVAALAGTRLQMRGKSSKKLKSAALKQQGGKNVVAAHVEPDGLTFVVPAPSAELLVSESGDYWFELTDEEDVIGAANQRFSMRAVPDDPPTVALEKPTTDLYLMPEATAPIRVMAKDRLALKAVDLHYSRSDRSAEPPTKISLYWGPKTVSPTDRQGMAVAADDGDRRVIDHTLPLADLNLKPGAQLTVHATATDYKPATGQSPATRIFIISARELEERVARQQTQVMGDLARALKMEQEARARVKGLEIQMEQVGKLKAADLDQLQAAELQQRDVRRMLTGSSTAARKQVAGLLEQLANNKLGSPQIERRMNDLERMLGELEQKALPGAERELTAALKNAQISRDRQESKTPRADSDTAQALTAAGQQQQEIIDALDQAVSEMKRWDKYREYSRDLAGIDEQQKKAREQTQQLMAKTLGRDVKSLTPQEVADLKKQAEKQAELAREFNKLMAGMQKAQKELQQNDPLAAQSLDDATKEAQQHGVAERMTSAATKIDRNQVADALRQQAEAGEGMQNMLEVLSNRREQELSRLVKKLKEAEQKLAELRKQQSALRKKMQEAGKKTDPEERRREMQRLAREQEQLQKEVNRLARQLQRLDARRASDKLAGAGAKMGQAGQQGEAGQADQAEDQAEAAEKDLEEAEQQLAQARRQAEFDLVQEQLVRLKDQLTGLKDHQQTLLTETERLEDLRQRQQRLTRGQESSVVSLARNQAGLQQDVTQAARKLAVAEGFGLALERAAAEMGKAVKALSRLETGAEPQQAQKRALDRLTMVLEALQPDKTEEDMENPGGQGQPPPGGDQQQQAGDGIHTLQELKLLKLMQQDVREQTDALETKKREGEALTDDEVRQLADLAEEQNRLADMMFKLREPAAAAPEDDPTKLPGPEPLKDEETDPDKADREPHDEKSAATR